jgi:FAD/FMN-containing dehydrogenase
MTTVIADTAVTKFQERLSGELLRPTDRAYDDARTVWNALVDKRPALIARCSDARDVVLSVTFAREHSLEVSVRGGGHNIAGNAVTQGGLMIDLTPMKAIDVNPSRRSVRAQAGLNLGEFDRGTGAYGLATTMGVATDTGIAGLTLGGGYGWLAGKYGLTCDNLISVDMVTADGKLITASADENADLFWGVRGGGGNFGIVTTFEYQLYPVEMVVGGLAVFPRTAEVLRYFDEFSRECPDELTTIGLVVTAPDGNPAFGIACCHSGDPDDAERALEPLIKLGPLVNMIERRPYVEMQTITDESWPPGRFYYWKSSLTCGLSDDLIEALLDAGKRMPKPYSMMYLQQLHGAASRVGPADTAFPHRFDHYNCGAMLETDERATADDGIRWSRETWEAIQPFVERSNYVNDLGEGDDDRVPEAYGACYERLVALKNRYDPTNIFHLNQNIKPTGQAAHSN